MDMDSSAAEKLTKTVAQKLVSDGKNLTEEDIKSIYLAVSKNAHQMKKRSATAIYLK